MLPFSCEKFVFCVPFRELQKGNNGSKGNVENVFCIGQCKLDKEVTVPTSIHSLTSLKIESIVMSEGSTVMSGSNLTPNDLHIYANPSGQSWDKTQVWYELLKILSGQRIYMETDSTDLSESPLRCCIEEIDTQWKIILEQSSDGIARKIGEIPLKHVDYDEIDLFALTQDLFGDLSQLNLDLHKSVAKTSKVSSQIETLQSEREKLDELIEIRDSNTKKLMVGLLNEKKQKISQLEEYIRRHNLGPPLPENKSDSDVINNHVTDEITELNSPGKRKKQGKIIKQRGKMLRKVKKDVNTKKLEASSVGTGSIPSLPSSDFNFYGISKGTDNHRDLETGASTTTAVKKENNSQILGVCGETTGETHNGNTQATQTEPQTKELLPSVLRMGRFQHGTVTHSNKNSIHHTPYGINDVSSSSEGSTSQDEEKNI